MGISKVLIISTEICFSYRTKRLQKLDYHFYLCYYSDNKKREVLKIKKIKILFLTSVFLLTSMLFYPSSNAEAAYSEWQTVYGSCKVRIWTDAINYYPSATSIDAYAETNGKCTTLYYDGMYVATHAAGGIGKISPSYSGYFKNRTPLKVFKTSKFDSISKPGRVFIILNLRDYGWIESHTLTWH